MCPRLETHLYRPEFEWPNNNETQQNENRIDREKQEQEELDALETNAAIVEEKKKTEVKTLI